MRHGDYAEPASLPGAFEDAEQLLLVSSSDPGADAVSLHRTAIEAAVAAGVGRILYTSHQGADSDSPFRPARDHAATEQLLAESGVPGRRCATASTRTAEWLSARGGRPESSPCPPTVRCRGRPGRTRPRRRRSSSRRRRATTARPPSPRARADVRRHRGDRLGADRPTVDAWSSTRRVGRGPGRPGSEFAARFTLGIYQAAQQGLFAGVDPLLGTLLGREPRTVRDLLAQPVT